MSYLICESAYWREAMEGTRRDIEAVKEARREGWQADVERYEQTLIWSQMQLEQVEAEEREHLSWSSERWAEEAQMWRAKVEFAEGDSNFPFEPSIQALVIAEAKGALSFYEGMARQIAQLEKEGL